MNKIGFDLAQFGNDENLYITKSGNSDVWYDKIERPFDLRDEYDLEDLIKGYLDKETLSKITFDSESSWFVVIVKVEFENQAEAIVRKFNEALKQAITNKIEEILL